jgi:hypothetical protein
VRLPQLLLNEGVHRWSPRLPYEGVASFLTSRDAVCGGVAFQR